MAATLSKNEAKFMRNETGTETGFGLITFGQTLNTENHGGNRSRLGEPSLRSSPPRTYALRVSADSCKVSHCASQRLMGFVSMCAW